LRERGAYFSSSRKSPSKGYTALWSEEDLVNGRRVRALSVVLRTKGCSWGKKANCSMCGYFVDSGEMMPIMEQFEKALSKRKNETMIKIYNSGSFLDPSEISLATQKRILQRGGEIFDRILIESRPEFINSQLLEDHRKMADLEVAIGLESSNDDVLLNSINKGFRFADYRKAAEILNHLEIPLRSYLLLKPPFISEGNAIDDAVSSIRAVEEFSSTISVNPMNIQNFTLVEQLFRKGEYKPPFLWSLLRVLKTQSSARLMSSPSGGGTKRGIHNCGNCDQAILENLREFSLSQDRSLLEYDCTCKEEWEDILVLEDTVQCSLRMD